MADGRSLTSGCHGCDTNCAATYVALAQAACDDVLMDFDSLREQNSDLGTAAVIVMVGGGAQVQQIQFNEQCCREDLIERLCCSSNVLRVFIVCWCSNALLLNHRYPCSHALLLLDMCRIRAQMSLTLLQGRADAGAAACIAAEQ
jgi:hypothetical protein